jgi:hypothetical protein
MTPAVGMQDVQVQACAYCMSQSLEGQLSAHLWLQAGFSTGVRPHNEEFDCNSLEVAKVRSLRAPPPWNRTSGPCTTFCEISLEEGLMNFRCPTIFSSKSQPPLATQSTHITSRFQTTPLRASQVSSFTALTTTSTFGRHKPVHSHSHQAHSATLVSSSHQPQSWVTKDLRTSMLVSRLREIINRQWSYNRARRSGKRRDHDFYHTPSGQGQRRG